MSPSAPESAPPESIGSADAGQNRSGLTNRSGPQNRSKNEGRANHEGLIGRAAARMQTVRVRILTAMLVIMVGVLAVAGGTAFALQAASVGERANEDIQQEIDELYRVVAAGPDGDGTGAFGSVDAVLEAAMTAGIPAGYESFLAVIDGRLAYVPAGSQDVDLNDPQIFDAIMAHADATQIVVRDIDTEIGELRVALVPVTVQGDDAQGYYVIANAIGANMSDVNLFIQVYALTALLAVIAAGIIGWVVTGRLLAPLRRVQETAEKTSGNDLTARALIGESNDDVSTLARRFNTMLDRLEQAFVDQRRFLNDAGHELRTPLTIIRGNIEVLDSSDSADVDETRELVLDELDRMQRLVDDLILLAKARRTDFVKPDAVDVAELLESVRDRAKTLTDQRVLIGARAHVVAQLDEQRISQALLQLCANAVKYAPESTEIVLGAQVVSERRELHLWVADRGPGIPDDEQGVIFERFARGQNHSGIDGSGLGLAIVRAIARAHGGEVRLWSRPSQGATFVLVLPMDDELSTITPTPQET